MKPHRTPAVGTRPSFLWGLEAFVLVVAVLYFGKPVIVPLALAVLLTFILTPVVMMIQRTGLSRVPAVLLTATISVLVIGIVTWVVGTQLRELANELPKHRKNIAEKISGLKGASNGPFAQVLQMIRKIDEEGVKGTSPENSNAGKRDATPAANSAPREVVVVQPAHTSSAEQVIQFIGPVLEPLAMAGLVAVLVIFILVNREDLRDRLIGLLGYGQLTGTTRVLVDTAERIGRFLLNLLLLNSTFGLIIALALLIIGVPYPFLWGFLAGLLRFIPYIGTWIAAALPLLLSFAIFPSWLQPVLVVACFALLDLVTANVVEPILFGHTTGLSPLALLVAAAFWTWIWGGIGLVLSTPLTVCLVVLGQHVPRLKFLELLLGDRPALAPHARYYQRLLARDRQEAVELLQQELAADPDHAFDKLLLPALELARRARHDDDLTADDERFIFESTNEILDEVASAAKEKSADEAADVKAAAPEGPIRVLACPSHHEAEEIAIKMLARLLAPDGTRVELVSTRALASEVEDAIAEHRPTVVFIGILPPGGRLQARYLCRRIHRRFPEIKIVIGYWGNPRGFDRVLMQLRAVGASYVTTSLVQARTQIRVLLEGIDPMARNKPAQPTPSPKEPAAPSKENGGKFPSGMGQGPTEPANERATSSSS